jgi:hypothetical protein
MLDRRRGKELNFTETAKLELRKRQHCSIFGNNQKAPRSGRLNGGCILALKSSRFLCSVLIENRTGALLCTPNECTTPAQHYQCEEVTRG